MAERYAWHGHRLAMLPPGESWLVGGARPRQPIDDVLDRSSEWSDLLAEPREVVAPPPVSAAPANDSRRWVVVLTGLGLAALITIIAAHRSGQVADPPPLPEQPSHVITALSPVQNTTVLVHVGDYIRFELPAGRAYSTVIEQLKVQAPSIEALTLPGQQPELRADTTGHAFVEVLTEPLCPTAMTCPDRRTLAGGLDITVLP